MFKYNNKIHEALKSKKRYEVFGYNKFGNFQCFGYYDSKDFENASPEFKAAYYEYYQYVLDIDNKYVDGPDREYLKAAKRLSKLEKEEGIKRFDSNTDIEEASRLTLNDLYR